MRDEDLDEASWKSVIFDWVWAIIVAVTVYCVVDRMASCTEKLKWFV